MSSNHMFAGVVGAAGNWRTLRVAAAAAQRAAAATHHAIPQPKRRTAAETVASVNRGLT